MRATIPRLGRTTRRLQLTSKTGGKDYYKGTGTGSMGEHTKYGGYRLDYNKVRTYVVPDMQGSELTATVRAYSTNEARARLQERRDAVTQRIDRLVRSLEHARDAEAREREDLEGRIELAYRDMEEGKDAVEDDRRAREQRRAELGTQLQSSPSGQGTHDEQSVKSAMDALSRDADEAERVWAERRRELEAHVEELQEQLTFPSTMSLSESQRQLTLEHEQAEQEFLETELDKLGEEGERRRAAEKLEVERRETVRRTALASALSRTRGVKDVLQRDFVRFEGQVLKKAYVRKILRERSLAEDQERDDGEALVKAERWLAHADWMPRQLDIDTGLLADRQAELDEEWDALERVRATRSGQAESDRGDATAVTGSGDQASQAQALVDEELAPRMVELEERQAELDEERLALEERRGNTAVFHDPAVISPTARATV